MTEPNDTEGLGHQVRIVDGFEPEDFLGASGGTYSGPCVEMEMRNELFWAATIMKQARERRDKRLKGQG